MDAFTGFGFIQGLSSIVHNLQLTDTVVTTITQVFKNDQEIKPVINDGLHTFTVALNVWKLAIIMPNFQTIRYGYADAPIISSASGLITLPMQCIRLYGAVDMDTTEVMSLQFTKTSLICKYDKYSSSSHENGIPASMFFFKWD